MPRESYEPVSSASTTCPRFLVARIVPQLSRSCRLAVDLPVLGVLTWLCAGARAPRRGILPDHLWDRMRGILPGPVTAAARRGALGRLVRAGLATVDSTGRYRPCWRENAVVARLDVDLWRRTDLSAAAKRIHAVMGPRIAAGRSDAARWVGEILGAGRGRVGAALVELETAGLVARTGTIHSAAGVRARWGTGTQSERVLPTGTGVAMPYSHGPTRAAREEPGPRLSVSRMRVATPPVPCPIRPPEPLRTRGDWRDAAAALAAPGPILPILERLGVGAQIRRLSPAGAAGLAAARQAVARDLERRGTTPATVVAFLLECEARTSPLRAGRILMAAVGHTRRRRNRGCTELEPYVQHTGAERRLPAGPRARDVTDLINRTASMLMASGLWVTNGREMPCLPPCPPPESIQAQWIMSPSTASRAGARTTWRGGSA